MKRASRSICVAIVLAGCGPGARHGATDGNTGTADSAGGGGDAGGNCADGAKDVYILDINYHLLRFDPPTKAVTDLGALSCPAMLGATPFSMGVDRTATAWVLYDSGELFHVNIATLACTSTSWSSPDNLKVFGMGFSADTSGGSTDSLFICGAVSQTQPPFTLARVDPTTLAATPLGTESTPPEMTGTATAQLWGFIPDATNARVVQLDKTNGSAITTFPQPSLSASGPAYAFAFWGGDFWVFFMPNTQTQSTVYQVNGTTGAITSATPVTGHEIVGAGVSTCAPVIQ